MVTNRLSEDLTNLQSHYTQFAEAFSIGNGIFPVRWYLRGMLNTKTAGFIGCFCVGKSVGLTLLKLCQQGAIVLRVWRIHQQNLGDDFHGFFFSAAIQQRIAQEVEAGNRLFASPGAV